MKERVTAPDLFTERLELHDITENDTDIIVGWRGDPNVYRYFISPHKITSDEHRAWFNSRYVYDNNRFDWIAFCDKIPIGIFGVKRESESSGTAEISYILAPDHYGKGYAGEAVKRLMTFCADEWKCRRVIAEIHKDNLSSIRFIERLSFVYESTNGNFKRYGIELYDTVQS